jgi:hypothetical protein
MSGSSNPPISQDEGDCVYDYFTFNMDELVYGADGVLYMPDKTPGQRDSEDDNESQDSNREDQENNDYPEERSSFDGEEEHPYRGGSDFDEEEVAVQRYNKKEERTKPLKNKLLE